MRGRGRSKSGLPRGRRGCGRCRGGGRRSLCLHVRSLLQTEAELLLERRALVDKLQRVAGGVLLRHAAGHHPAVHRLAWAGRRTITAEHIALRLAAVAEEPVDNAVDRLAHRTGRADSQHTAHETAGCTVVAGKLLEDGRLLLV